MHVVLWKKGEALPQLLLPIGLWDSISPKTVQHTVLASFIFGGDCSPQPPVKTKTSGKNMTVLILIQINCMKNESYKNLPHFGSYEA